MTMKMADRPSSIPRSTMLDSRRVAISSGLQHVPELVEHAPDAHSGAAGLVLLGDVPDEDEKHCEHHHDGASVRVVQHVERPWQAPPGWRRGRRYTRPPRRRAWR